MNYAQLIHEAVDLHVHVGPEIIPRKFTVSALVAAERGKLKGVAVKSHFAPTVGLHTAETRASTSPLVVDSITLNHGVGGFRADAVRAAARRARAPIIVWFPTIHAANMLAQQEEEIPREWLDAEAQKSVPRRRAADIPGLSVFDASGSLRTDVVEVLKAIQQCGAILATGHLSWRESRALVTYAMRELGLDRVILTHPVYQAIDMPVAIQRELAHLGAYVEHCFSMYSIDKIPVAKIARQIRAVGPASCLLSSDVGQTFSKNPSAALAEFLALLAREGVTEPEMHRMLVENPVRLLTGDVRII